MPFAATWMDLDIVRKRKERSQKKKKGKISYDITYMWNLKKMVEMKLF